MNYVVQRLNAGQPIVSRATFVAAGIAEDGANINGPSAVRVPDWIAPDQRADPRAQYYLYFAHHGGRYIRMAWAAEVGGPYHLYTPPAPRHGVLHLPLVDGRPLLQFANGVAVTAHIASPNVHVDAAARQFVLYFHGPSNTSSPSQTPCTGPQKTLVATSATGLNFNRPEDGGETGHGPQPALLGNAYFCVFAIADHLYAFSNGGELWRAPVSRAWQPAEPPTADAWERGPNPIADALAAVAAPSSDPRHFAVRSVGPDRLEVFYSLRGDTEESIELMEVDLAAGDWWSWRAMNRSLVLRPEQPWEGLAHPLRASRAGGQTGVRQLRDPAIFADADGSVYLFYSGAGEEAIGVARLLAG